MTLIRPIDPSSDSEILLVAGRMRETLVEVLGAARGGEMYEPEWLEARVRWHLDASACTGAVFVAEDDDALVGHTIVRLERASYGESEEPGEDEPLLGLFSTIYVVPSARRAGVANALIERGEAWMHTQGMTRAATLTDAHNTKLHELFFARGYSLTPLPDDFVRLSRTL